MCFDRWSFIWLQVCVWLHRFQFSSLLVHVGVGKQWSMAQVTDPLPPMWHPDEAPGLRRTQFQPFWPFGEWVRKWKISLSPCLTNKQIFLKNSKDLVTTRIEYRTTEFWAFMHSINSKKSQQWLVYTVIWRSSLKIMRLKYWTLGSWVTPQNPSLLPFWNMYLDMHSMILDFLPSPISTLSWHI